MHSYEVTLDSGQLLHVAVRQHGIYLAVTIFDPDGRKVLRADCMSGAVGPEHVKIIAERRGKYRLDVSAWEKQAGKGSYDIRIRELRGPTPPDLKRFAASLAIENGARLTGEGSPGSLEAAFGKYTEALLLAREAGDRYQEGCALRGIGNLNQRMRRDQEALRAHLDSLQAFRDVRSLAEEAAALYSIGDIHYSIGERRKALEFFKQALTSCEAAGMRDLAAMTLNIMGVCSHWFGDIEKALDYYHQALDVLQEMGDSRAAAAINNIGFVYESLGENEMALESYRNSLRISEKAGNTYRQVITLNGIGDTYLQAGDREKALESYLLALPVSRAAKFDLGIATTLINIGRLYNLRGEPEKALEYLNQALPIAQASAERGIDVVALYSIGVTYAALGDSHKATDSYHRAIQLSRTIEDQVSEANSLYLLARTQRRLGKPDDALQNVEHAIRILESRRSRLANPEMRASYFASAREYYDLDLDLLMLLDQIKAGMGYDRRALHASERRRARTLLELLAEGRVDVRHGGDRALLNRERSLTQEIAQKSELYSRLVDPARPGEQGDQLRREIDQALSEHRRIQSQIRSASPGYAALMFPSPLTADQIQQEVVDQDTLLLEYALGEECSYLWVVTPQSTNAFRLPKRPEIEVAARRVYELFAAAGIRTSSRSSVDRQPAQGMPQYIEAATALTRMILEPAREYLGEKRLVIVTDGALDYVPFGALPSPACSSWDYQTLIQKHEIVYLPSASTLAVLRRNAADRVASPKSVAVFADPVFDANDDRVRRRRRPRFQRDRRTPAAVAPSEHLSRLALERSARAVGLTRQNNFPRLPFSRREADAIHSLSRGQDVLRALDFDCNKAAALDPALKSYRILHFATHSLINNEHPELSGIVMSLVDRTGRSRNGFVRLMDIYNLDLNADLVVLSACQTALGKNVAAEGLVGLTRGFMYAGAPRIVATLWKVDDQATAELMKKFYEALLIRGERPAAALRDAQIWMQQLARWRSPYYWAGFVLQGEWR